MSLMEDFDHLKIQMEDIVLATNNFDPKKKIGGGGFGPVYKGELSLPKGPSMVAFKLLDRRYGQGNTEFWKEIMMLSKCKHENLVSLLHFCIEGEERVLVYEYASRGSLERYLNDVSLTWNQRLHICIGVARALKYLHDPMKTQQRVLHRDIKSANILLDEKWNAKVSDFGLSKFGPANQPQTYLVSNVVGTPGYCDPLYWEIGFLTKESDVYSFGVVLFEVMCGRSCCEYRNGELIGFLVPKWKTFCDEMKPDDIVFPDLKEQIVWDSLITFSAIANQCLNRDRRERPTMDEIVTKLEVALEQQNNVHESDLVKISKLAVPPLSYSSEEELISLLSQGILVDDGKRWLSINKKEETLEMICAAECIHGPMLVHLGDNQSRFSNLLVAPFVFNFKVEVRTQFLKPRVTYTINLLYKHKNINSMINPSIKYKLEGETDYWKPSIVTVREDGWVMVELYQFTSYQKEHHFKIEFERSGIIGGRYFEGIEFRPIEQNQEDKNMVDIQQVSNSDMDWVKMLSPEYIDIIKLSKDKIQWTNEKELFFLLRQGFFIHNGKKVSSYMWFSLSKNMKKRLMISAKAILIKKDWIWKSLSGSRFKVMAESLDRSEITVDFRINLKLLSLETSYSVCLIYKLPQDFSSLDDNLITIQRIGSGNYVRCIYLVPRQPTPILGSKVGRNSGSLTHTHKTTGRPELRNDGWMEISLCEVSTNAIDTTRMQFTLRGPNVEFGGLLIQGIKFRPL